MHQSSVDRSPLPIESRIRELVDRERRLTFTTLTSILSDCRWISILRALNHLEQQRVVTLTPLPWDYEICGATTPQPAQGAE